MGDEVPRDSERAMAVAERHRDHISKWFYYCSPDTHARLGEMYVADRRFRENIDKAGAGFAAYMSAAILANARLISPVQATRRPAGSHDQSPG